MKAVQILHLTDLHLKAAPSWDQQMLQRKLLEDLRGLATRGQKPDLLIFSGDLADAAGEPSAYDPVDTYLASVIEASAISADRVIVCPGNHDADRRVIGPQIPSLKDWRARAASADRANSLAEDTTFLEYVNQNFSTFKNGIGKYDIAPKSYSDPFASLYNFPELDLAVAVFNTATLTGAGLTPDIDDRAQMFIPESSIVRCLEAAPPHARKIAIGHHPLSWMNDDNSVLLHRALPQLCTAYFCGHLHESTPSQNRSLNGDLLVAQSGALYAHRKYWNGYAVVSFQADCHGSRVAFRRWFEPRRSFSKAEDLGDDGTFYSSETARDYWIEQLAGPNSKSLDDWRKTQLLPELIAECNNSFATQDLDSVFVMPEFDHEVPYGIEADGRVGSRLELMSFHDVIASDKNYVVSASSETGKSTMLKQIALDYAKREATSPDWTFPAIVQFAAIRPITGHIEKMIRQNLPELPPGTNVKKLLESGSMIVLVDDVDFAIKQKRDALIKFVTQYPNCRYIFTSGTPFVESSALRPEISPDVPFSRIRMRPIRPEQILTLIESHGTTDPLEADRMLARVLRDANALNVPLTAVTGTFLIQIFHDDPDHVMLNQAALTERYVEILLQKYAPRELLPGTFDFKNKVDLLSTITELMVRTNDYAPDYNTILSWCMEYLKSFGLKFSANDLLSYFIEARIFENDGSSVRFRLKMFFEFFAAMRMIDHPSFKAYVLDKERYLSFINEIAFYAALNRKDGLLVKEVHDELVRLSEEEWEEGKIPDPESFIANFVVPGKHTTEQELDEIYRTVRTAAELRIDRERLKEGIELVSSDASQLVARMTYQTVSERWFAHLVLLSTLVKHMELIPNTYKREYLAGALDGWVQFTANSLGIVNALAKERRVTFNGITYVSTLSDTLPVGEVARRLALSMPAAAARMATTFMGSEKLVSQLHDGIGSDKEPLGRQLLRISVLADLGSPDVARLSSRAAEKMKGKRFLSHALARKLYEVAVRFRLAKVDLAEVRSVAADLYVALEGVPGGKVAARKAAIIEGMASQRRQIEFLADKPKLGDDAKTPEKLPHPRPKKGRRGRRKR